MNSHITPDEALTLQMDARFDGETIAYRNVSNTQLSIARHSGGATVNGKFFKYFPVTDELIRDDVLKALKQYRKQSRALDKLAAASQQLGLGY